MVDVAADDEADKGGLEAMNNYLKIWQWEDAPEEYRKLSGHAGDEDWVMLAPKYIGQYWPLALEAVIRGDEDSYLNHFGHVDRHELPEGVVVIFAHA